MEGKLKTSDTHINKFRTVIKKMDKMKTNQFTKFKEQLTSVDRDKRMNSRCLSEAILLETVK